jgi:HrpA-like RNA helicase
VISIQRFQEEILSAVDTLNSYAEENNSKNQDRKHFPSGIAAYNLKVVPLYGALPHRDQLKAFSSTGREARVRQLVVATNIAETAVTVPGVSYGQLLYGVQICDSSRLRQVVVATNRNCD